MAGPRARREQDDIDANVVARIGIAWHQIFGRRRDAGEAALVDREIELGGGGAQLDLDKGDEGTFLGDQIDFACGGTDAAGEDAPAFEAEPPAGEALAAAAGGFGEAALYIPLPFTGGVRGGGSG